MNHLRLVLALAVVLSASPVFAAPKSAGPEQDASPAIPQGLETKPKKKVASLPPGGCGPTPTTDGLGEKPGKKSEKREFAKIRVAIKPGSARAI